MSNQAGVVTLSARIVDTDKAKAEILSIQKTMTTSVSEIVRINKEQEQAAREAARAQREAAEEVARAAREAAREQERSAQTVAQISRSLQDQINRNTMDAVEYRKHLARQEAQDIESTIRGLTITREDQESLISKNTQAMEARITRITQDEANKREAVEEAETKKRLALEEAESRKVLALEEVENRRRTALEESETRKRIALEEREAQAKKAEIRGVITSVTQLAAAYISIAGTVGIAKMGIGYNSEIESMKLGLASIVSANEIITDQYGQRVEGSQKLAMAEAQVGEIFGELKQDAIDTTATLPQLIGAFQAAAGPAMSLGISLEDTRKITVGMVQAMGAMHIPLEQSRQEINSILQGQITEDSQLAKNLGITNEQVKVWKQKGTLVTEILDRLKDFSVAGEKAGETWEGVMSTLADNTSSTLGIAFQGVFEDLKGEALALNKSAFGPEAQENAAKVGEILQDGLEGGLIIAKAIGGVLIKGAETAMAIVNEVRLKAADLGAAAGRDDNRDYAVEQAGFGAVLKQARLMKSDWKSGIQTGTPSDQDILDVAKGMGLKTEQIKRLKQAIRTGDIRTEGGRLGQRAEIYNGWEDYLKNIDATLPRGTKITPKSTGQEDADGKKDAKKAAEKAANDQKKLAEDLQKELLLINKDGFARQRAEAMREHQDRLKLAHGNATLEAQSRKLYYAEVSKIDRDEKAKQAADRVSALDANLAHTLKVNSTYGGGVDKEISKTEKIIADLKARGHLSKEEIQWIADQELELVGKRRENEKDIQKQIEEGLNEREQREIDILDERARREEEIGQQRLEWAAQAADVLMQATETDWKDPTEIKGLAKDTAGAGAEAVFTAAGMPELAKLGGWNIGQNIDHAANAFDALFGTEFSGKSAKKRLDEEVSTTDYVGVTDEQIKAMRDQVTNAKYLTDAQKEEYRTRIDNIAAIKDSIDAFKDMAARQRRSGELFASASANTADIRKGFDDAEAVRNGTKTQAQVDADNYLDSEMTKYGDVLGSKDIARIVFEQVKSGDIQGAMESTYENKAIVSSMQDIVKNFQNYLNDPDQVGNSPDKPLYTVVVNQKDPYAFQDKAQYFRGGSPNTTRRFDNRGVSVR